MRDICENAVSFALNDISELELDENVLNRLEVIAINENTSSQNIVKRLLNKYIENRDNYDRINNYK